MRETLIVRNLATITEKGSRQVYPSAQRTEHMLYWQAKLGIYPFFER